MTSINLSQTINFPFFLFYKTQTEIDAAQKDQVNPNKSFNFDPRLLILFGLLFVGVLIWYFYPSNEVNSNHEPSRTLEEIVITNQAYIVARELQQENMDDDFAKLNRFLDGDLLQKTELTEWARQMLDKDNVSEYVKALIRKMLTVIFYMTGGQFSDDIYDDTSLEDVFEYMNESWASTELKRAGVVTVGDLNRLLKEKGWDGVIEIDPVFFDKKTVKALQKRLDEYQVKKLQSIIIKYASVDTPISAIPGFSQRLKKIFEDNSIKTVRDLRKLLEDEFPDNFKYLKGAGQKSYDEDFWPMVERYRAE